MRYRAHSVAEAAKTSIFEDYRVEAPSSPIIPCVTYLSLYRMLTHLSL